MSAVSVPAHEAEPWASPARHPARRRAAEPAHGPDVPAARPRIPNPPHPHRRARRGPHSAFWLFSMVVLCSMAVGLVSLNAMRVDAAYRTRSFAERVRLLADERGSLVNDVARLSSPSRIGSWARANGLVHPAPGDVVILQVPGSPEASGARPSEAGE